MALRTQTVRPTLCRHACLVEQTWDDATGLVVDERMVEFCPRHKGKAAMLSLAAISDESDRWNKIVAVADGLSLSFAGGKVTASAEMNDATGNLEVTVTGLTANQRSRIVARLPARVVLV